MKNLILNLLIVTCLLAVTSCDKGFKQLNVNPNSPTSLDAAFLFTNAEFSTYSTTMENEPTIVQQFINPFSGITSAFNFNSINQTYTSPHWNTGYTGSIKLLTQILTQVEGNPARVNLYNEARIWRAYQFMMLVDTYGDVPYTDAGLAYLNSVYFPKYDKQQTIYADLVNELTTASAALDPTKDIVTADIFYGGNVAQWKKLGYSLLLRIGMRYSRVDAAKAQATVQAAVAGGVMQSNADNCVIKYNTTYTNPVSNNIQTLTNTYYLAEPFVTQLKTTGDPRLKYISAKYSNPGSAPTLVGDTTSANQFGLPVGYDAATLPSAPGYRGAVGSGFNYSQVNYSIFAKLTAPQFIVTYAQTELLLAEAAFRGWISGSPATFYNAGVSADMDRYAAYDATAVIPPSTEASYLNNPLNAYNPANALALINTQYWIASWGNGAEAWANFRRSGYPALSPNMYPGRQIHGNFVQRFVYPTIEQTVNAANYQAAVADNGGPDDMDTQVFWAK